MIWKILGLFSSPIRKEIDEIDQPLAPYVPPTSQPLLTLGGSSPGLVSG